MYPLTSYEQQLIKNDLDLERLTYLERKSITRLQFICQQKKFYIKSIADENQLYRMIILSLLFKMFKQQSELNQKRMNIFKQIVYASELEKLSFSKGLIKQQVHKSIAVNLNNIITNQNYEERIVYLFNSISFFDEILIQSFIQIFGKQPEINVIQKMFDIKIIWNQQNDNQICLNQILLVIRNKHILINTENFQVGDTEVVFSSAQYDKSERSEQKQLLQTISIESLQKSNNKNKQNINRQNRLSKEISIFQIPIKKSTSPSIWSILCCGTD